MSQAFYSFKHPTIIAKMETVVLTIAKDIYKNIQTKLLEDILEKTRD